MENFKKKYEVLFEKGNIETKNLPIEDLLEKGFSMREEASDTQNTALYEKSSHCFFLCSSYFFNEYKKTGELRLFSEACILKYEQIKGLFCQLYIEKIAKKSEVLKVLNTQIEFLEGIIKIFEKEDFFEKNNYEYTSLLYSDKIIRFQLNSNLDNENKNFLDAKSKMKLAIELTSKHIEFLKESVFEGRFNIVHLRIEEANLKMRYSEYEEMVAISFIEQDITSSLSSFFKALDFVNEALAIYPDMQQIHIKKNWITEKIKMVLKEEKNLKKYDIFYKTFRSNENFLMIMQEINPQKLSEFTLEDPLNSGRIQIINSGSFENSGIIGDNSQLSKK